MGRKPGSLGNHAAVGGLEKYEGNPLPDAAERIARKAAEKIARKMDMNSTIGKNKFKYSRGPLRSWLLAGGLALGTAAAVAACGSSPSSTAAGSPGSSAPPSASSAASATISAKSVSGVGTVLVNGQGQTLYMLTSEKGGKITCTQANGCTQAWPETLLANGATAATAGSGVQSSLLGTVKDASGNLEVTYNHWPLYTFSGDSGPGVAKGQGLTSFGGTWYVLSGSGNPVTSSQSGTASSGGGSGY
jgi:predicted lipoprotein with Yx(FWY)xxD motif